MKMKNYFLMLITILSLSATQAQINSIQDFVIKNEELKMLTFRIAKNYIMTGVLPNNKKLLKEYEDDKNNFQEILIELTNNSPNDEIEIELQKLNLSWMMMDRILNKKYDAAAALKVLNYSEKMVDEIENITKLVLQSTKQKAVRYLKASSDGRMLSQKLLLYYMANKVKMRNPEIPQRFDETKTKLYDIIKLLTDAAQNDPNLKTDEGIQLYIDMIKDSYGKVRKTLTLKSKVHPLTANLIVNQLTENFNLLTNLIYEKFNG